MLTSQRKLMAAFAGIVLLGVLVAGFSAERNLRRDQLESIARSLRERASLVAEQVRELGSPPFGVEDRPRLDALADRAGRAGAMRITFIAADGAVLGDSDIPLERLPDVENHAGRPEVHEALAGQVGRDARRSATVGRELLYLALPEEHGGVIVRASVDLSEIDAAVAALRGRLLFGAVVGLGVAAGLALWISRLTVRPIEELRRVVASIAGGHLDDRLPLNVGDDLKDIYGAVNQMAEQLRLRLEEVTHEKEQLHAVLEGMVEGVLVVDAKGTVVLANSRLREFYGVSDDIVGRPLIGAIRDVDLEALLREASEQSALRSVTLTGPARRTLRIRAAPFPARGGPHAGTVAVFDDITELERLEEVRRDFVANASHELRTPLTAIHGFAETLLEGGDVTETERRSYLEIIDRHARRLANIVNDLLELSTIETGKIHLEPTRMDVGALAESVVRDADARCRERRLAVSVRIEGDCHAHADPRAIEQVLTNLLDNAVKYTEPGGSIEITVGESNDRVRIAVRDSGIGIPEEDRARIFERFYRVDKARSRALGGTGLGLSIVKHLVQSMGGEISVRSELGRGSTFTVSLLRSESA